MPTNRIAWMKLTQTARTKQKIERHACQARRLNQLSERLPTKKSPGPNGVTEVSQAFEEPTPVLL